LPGEQGNFAVAGHRVSKGSPFNDLGLLNSCDAVVVETQDDWFVYRVLPMAEQESTWAATPRPHCAGVQVQTLSAEKGKMIQTLFRSANWELAGACCGDAGKELQALAKKGGLAE